MFVHLTCIVNVIGKLFAILKFISACKIPAVESLYVNLYENKNALTWGLTDNFAADVTYLQFPIQICFSLISRHHMRTCFFKFHFHF